MTTPLAGSRTFCKVYLRQIRKLPGSYLQGFYRLKLADNLCALRNTQNSRVRRLRERRLERDLRKVNALNEGRHKTWEHALNQATGRKGRLKHELMPPVLADTTSTTHPRIIPSVESSRPPVYSPQLKALLTSDHGRGPGALNSRWLKVPMTMPERGDPNSEDAKLIGPLSKRRRVNIHWRFYTSEVKKVFPPLQLVTAEPESDVTMPEKGKGKQPGFVREKPPPPMAMQGSGLMEAIVKMADSPHKYETVTRIQRKLLEKSCQPIPQELPVQRPSRFLRRRYQEVLHRIPILTYNAASKTPVQVTVHPDAIIPGQRHREGRTREASEADIAWMNLPATP